METSDNFMKEGENEKISSIDDGAVIIGDHHTGVSRGAV